MRIFTIDTARGFVDVVQAITELTPQWTKVEGISHAWDMRIATSCIPRDILRKILLKQIDRKSVESYKKVARFYLQCERYADARQILEGLLAASPDDSDLKEQLAPSLRAIRQLSAQQLLGELKLRHDAGQHQLVGKTLKQFPAEGVGGEILQAVREMSADYETRRSRCRDVVKHLKALAAKIPDTIARENLKPILDEMAAEIDFNTLDRMAAFLQSADDRETENAEKLSLAISGWLLGADAATPKLATAISAYKVRGLILEYLAAASAPERERAYDYIEKESGGDPAMVAELLAHMKPPVAAPRPWPASPATMTSRSWAWPRSRQRRTTSNSRPSTILIVAIRRS